MDERKFEIIICATDEKYFSRLMQSLEGIVVPKDFSVAVRAMKDERGDLKYKAFDAAMRASDAKFKIYLDERLIVTNKNFLVELLRIFDSDKKIAAVGTSGAVELSTHGISSLSAKRTPKNFYGEAQVADGFFLATQYDLPWRHDLFNDTFFGGQAQCVEFRRAGYKIFIGGDWVAYGGGNFSFDEANRQKFLAEYSKDLFPLVSVVIPTFNRPKFFKEALDSARNQTYRNLEIFISDNSTDDATEQLIETYDDARIKYFRHKNFDANDNWNFARDYNNPAAEYVDWLMDDDLFYPTKIEKMVEVYRNNPDVSLVTSKRNYIDAEGKIFGAAPTPFKNSVKVAGEETGNFLLKTSFPNFIGEPTTVLIRKKFLRNGDLCWNDDERGFFNLVDMSTWLQLLSKGNLYFLDEPLSCCRHHSGIASLWDYTHPLVAIQWAKMIKTAWERKIFLKSEEDVRLAILQWFGELGVRRLKISLEKKYHGKEVETLEKYFVAMAKALSNGYKINLPPVKYSAQDGVKKMR